MTGLGLLMLISGAQLAPAAEKSAPTPPAAQPDTPATPRDPATAPPPSDPAAAPSPDAQPAAETPTAEDRSRLRDIGQVEDTGEVKRESPRRGNVRRHGSGDFPFGEHTIPAGSSMGEAVSILGSTTVAGEVRSDAVSVVGSTRIAPGGKVGGAAVAVLGRLESDGEIGNEAVSVLGSSRINGPVGGEAVAVLGNLELGPLAVINGDVVVVGGRLTKHPDAIVNGNEVRVPLLGPVGNLDWLSTWLKRCAFYGRPLAFGWDLGWAWAIAFSFFAFYLLLAALFPGGVVKCVETLETRPGYSVLTSVLTVLLTPIVMVLLAVTIVGALLVPFLGVGLFFGGLFGKAVMLGWIGRRFTKFFGDGPLGHPAFAVLIGGLFVLLIYTVPIMGFLTYKLLSWLGLGVVVYTIALSMKRDRPKPPPASATLPPRVPNYPVAGYTSPTPVPPATSAFRVAPSGIVAAPISSPGFSGTTPTATELPQVPEAGPAPMPPSLGEPNIPSASLPPSNFPPPPPPPIPPGPYGETTLPPHVSAAVPPPLVPAAVVWPRAGFFIRLGALAIDAILIGLIMAFIDGILPRWFEINNGPGGWLLALAIYGALMWKSKGTTIGGIVCGLKVVRVDNRPIDWPTAIVRALSCFLSLAVAGLGFIWVAIDEERQSWHDKIAGTAVVVAPKGVSLI